MQKIKVTYVVNDLLVGGAQKLVYDLARKLDKQNFDVTVYYLYDYENKKVTLKNKFLEEGFVDGANLICLENSELSNKKRDFKSLIQTCKKEFQKNKPDIVHIHLPNSLIVAGVASIFTKTPFIIHEHNTHNFHSWKIKMVFFLLRPFSKLTICYAETVEKETFHSSNVITDPDQFNKIYPAQKVITVLNGIDVSGLKDLRIKFAKGTQNFLDKRKSIGVGESDIVIFSAARFVKWKGHHLLVEGFNKLLNHRPPGVGGESVVLVIAGEGPEKEACEKMAANFGISEKVKFLGGRTDVGELLAIADIYSLVFDYEKNMGQAEAIGIAGFEGMATGLPTLIGDFGGANFYIKNWDNGVIVKKWDTDDLSLCLEKLINDQNLREKIGQNASERIYELLDWSTIIQIYNKIYSDILN